MKKIVGVVAAIGSLACVQSAAAETIYYTYDAKGRLVKVVKSNTTYTQVVSDISYDKADNRKRVVTTASPR